MLMVLLLLLLKGSSGHLLLMLLLLLLLGGCERSHHVARCSTSDATAASRGSLLGVVALLLGLAVVHKLLELLVLLVVVVQWLLRAGFLGIRRAVMAIHEVVRRLECLLVQGDLGHIFLLPSEHEFSFLLVLATSIAGAAPTTLRIFLQLFDPVTVS